MMSVVLCSIMMMMNLINDGGLMLANIFCQMFSSGPSRCAVWMSDELVLV